MISGGELDGNILGDCSCNLIMIDFQILDNDDNKLDKEDLRILDLASWQFCSLEVKKGTVALNLILMNKGRLFAEAEVTMLLYT